MLWLSLALQVDFIKIIGLGVLGGICSGLLSVSSGIVVTPTLITLGVPPSIAITSQLNNVVGGDLSGFINYWKKRDVDLSLAFYLVIGGIMGAILEKALFTWILGGKDHGNLSFIIIYSFILLTLTITSFYQSFFLSFSSIVSVKRSISMHKWMLYLPLHKIFSRSRAEISLIVPLTLGGISGFLTAILGGGTTLIMVPALTYIIARSSLVVSGTTLLAGFLITVFVCFLHSHEAPYDPEILLGLLLGSVMGSRLGVHFSYRINIRYLNILRSFIFLFVFIKFVGEKFILKEDSLLYKYTEYRHIFLDQGSANIRNWIDEYGIFLYTLSGIIVSIIFSLGFNNLINRILSKK